MKIIKKFTKKYEYSSRSDELYTEIIQTCTELHNDLFNITQSTLNIISNPQGKVDDKVKNLKYLMTIFYNLNA